MKIKKWEISLLAAIIITIIVSGFVSAGHSELSDKLIRLHVVANSDSDEDQALKLRVRDAVLDALAEPLSGVTDAGEAHGIIENSFALIENAALSEVTGSGFDYNVSVSLRLEDFPTREYDSFSLPAGEYTALRVELGESIGQNWWCVVFPPLCTEVATTSDAEAFAMLTDDEVRLITGEDGYVVRFKCMELLASLKSFFKK